MSEWSAPVVLLIFLSLILVAAVLLLLARIARMERTSGEAALREDEINARLYHMEGGLYSAVNESLRTEQAQMDALSQRILQVSAIQEERLERIRLENERQLTEMRRTVDDRLQNVLEKQLTESFNAVSKRLAEVGRGLGEMQELAHGVADIRKTLTNVKTRGVWGEMQLEALLTEMLAPTQFERNCEVVPASGQRVEFALKLPSPRGGAKPVYLAVDSKFPLEDSRRWQNALENGDSAAAAEAEKALSRAIMLQAKQISEKYIKPPFTVDYAVMFVPTESLYAALVSKEETFIELQKRYRVLPSGPSTLCALLSSLQTGFQSIAIAERSQEVFKLLMTVREEFAAFAQLLEKTQLRLQQASSEIESASSRTKQLQRRLSQVSSGAIAPDGEE
ncbi:MAG: DNA recombination protein RmuC [Eubacteriales bacterium]|nr:DNA recombination protein RmuC [Eubacteriales bacterium]MDD3882541.1 DNA recombination protein RmuC [Eubacteriales bacterium]MDD4512841.1 DNA recombination protein RmuC [Eubacteriales bacterium]